MCISLTATHRSTSRCYSDRELTDQGLVEGLLLVELAAEGTGEQALDLERHERAIHLRVRAFVHRQVLVPRARKPMTVRDPCVRKRAAGQRTRERAGR
eukprot:772035-Rhodomonas_salina.4